MNAGLIGLVLGMSLESSLAQVQVTRGPYLQSGSQTNLVLRWRTDRAADSRVAYGTNPLLLDQIVTRPGTRTDHTVLAGNLTPGTRYYYAIGTSTEWLAWGPEFRFQTAPAATQPVRIWAIGDSGTASAGDFGSWEVRDAYEAYRGAEDTDVWLMLGDNAYGSGTDEEYQVAVFETYPNLLRQTVLWSTIGNHETYSADLDGHFAYLDIFTLPRNGEAGGVPSGTSRYYSFDYSNIHFVCLDSETSGRLPDDPMPSWLRQDLMATTKDWIIAFWHSPPYSKGSHDSDREFELIGMRERMVPILEEFGVDLVLCGHSHNYERSFLLHGHYGSSSSLLASMILDGGSGRTNETGPYTKSSQGPAAQAGTVYVVAGSSGWATFTTGRHPVMHSQILATGSLVVDVDRNRLDAKFLRATGAIEDSFTILKGTPAESFKLVEIHWNDGKEIVRWKSQPGQSYQLQWTESLHPPDWFSIGGLIQASGMTTSWTNPVPQSWPQSYYRVLEAED